MVQHQQKSLENDEPLFRRDLKEIQSEALKNYNKQATILTETSFESKRYDTMTSSKLFIPIEGKTGPGGSSGAQQPQQGGNFLSIFTRIVNVFKTPFGRKSQIKDNNPQPIQITSTNSSSNPTKGEYKEFLINEHDEVIEQDVRVFTIDGHDASGSGDKGLKPRVSKMSSGKTHQKDFTPKEVAKMRKSKTANDVNKTSSGWKCCLF
jgi:hypothetical protein